MRSHGSRRMAEILVFGDSHVASLSPPLEELASGTSIIPRFVSAPGPVLTRLAVEGDKLTLEPAPDSWGHATVSDKSIHSWYALTAGQIRDIAGADGAVDLSLFDAIVCVGGHLTSWWPPMHDVIVAPQYSGDCAFRACSDMFARTPHMRWVGAITPGCAPVYSMPEPLTNEGSPKLEAPGARERNFAIVEETLSLLLQDAGTKYVPMPPGLLSAGGHATAARFKHEREGDYTHVNDEGARLMARHLLDMIAPTCKADVEAMA